MKWLFQNKISMLVYGLVVWWNFSQIRLFDSAGLAYSYCMAQSTQHTTEQAVPYPNVSWRKRNLAILSLYINKKLKTHNTFRKEKFENAIVAEWKKMCLLKLKVSFVRPIKCCRKIITSRSS